MTTTFYSRLGNVDKKTEYYNHLVHTYPFKGPKSSLVEITRQLVDIWKLRKEGGKTKNAYHLGFMKSLIVLALGSFDCHSIFFLKWGNYEMKTCGYSTLIEQFNLWKIYSSTDFFLKWCNTTKLQTWRWARTVDWQVHLSRYIEYHVYILSFGY